MSSTSSRQNDENEKITLPQQPEARAPLPREGKGPGEGLLKELNLSKN